MSTALEIVTKIVAEGHASAFGTDIFIDQMPQSPDSMIAVYNSGGPAGTLGFGSSELLVDRPTIQIRVRGTPEDSRTPHLLALAIHDMLGRLQAVTLNDGISEQSFYHSLTPVQEPFIFDRDESKRVIYLFNLAIEKDVPSAIPVSVWDDLVAGYHFEEATGATRADVLSIYDLTDVSANVGQTAGKINNGALLAVSGAELNHATTDFAFPGDWTVCCWIKNIVGWSPFSDQWLCSFGPSGVDWMLQSGSAQLTVQVVDTNGSSLSWVNLTAYTPSNNTWYFVAFTYDSTSKLVRASVDGGNFQDGLAALPNGMRTQGTQLRLRNIAPFSIDWAVDELYLFDVKKDDAWMTTMYGGGSGVAYPTEP